METFTKFCTDVAWPLCILLWTIMGVVSVFESWQKHRHTIKDGANVLKRLEKLELKLKSNTKKIDGKVKETHIVTDDESGQPKLRIHFESGAIYEINYSSDN